MVRSSPRTQTSLKCAWQLGRPVPDYAKSSLYVAKHYLTTGGDIALAHEYLEQVAASNSEEVGQATELLKQAKHLITMDAGAHDKVPNDANPTFQTHKGSGHSLATE